MLANHDDVLADDRHHHHRTRMTDHHPGMVATANIDIVPPLKGQKVHFFEVSDAEKSQGVRMAVDAQTGSVTAMPSGMVRSSNPRLRASAAATNPANKGWG